MVRPTVAKVSLPDVQANLRAIRGLLDRQAGLASVPPPGIIAVVKANAYGHGAAAVAGALEAAGVTMLACADIEEGAALRDAGISVPILVFGALSVSDLDGVFTHELTPTVSTPGAARALETAAAARSIRLGCHLKIDTGMNRLGFRHDNLRRTMPDVLASPHLQFDAVYTHFATADNPESAFLDEQRGRFDRATAALGALGLRAAQRHAANSAALLRDARTWYDAVRPGLLLYGVVPPPLSASDLDLRPALSLVSRIVAVKGVRAGEASGYGLKWRPSEPRTIAIVPAGYADGLDTRAAGRASVLVRGKRAPIVGSVCMDMITVDVTGTDVSPGDDVVLIGRQGDEEITAREIAAAIGSIPWEVMSRLGSRVDRHYD
ncbi:MAG TPA: alanine racemase [Vicinamibacterales bacterium]|nr:alanine racemase [Vicinamibacterales bacterium]